MDLNKPINSYLNINCKCRTLGNFRTYKIVLKEDVNDK